MSDNDRSSERRSKIGKRLKTLKERHRLLEICTRAWECIIESEAQAVFNVILSITPKYKGESQQR